MAVTVVQQVSVDVETIVDRLFVHMEQSGYEARAPSQAIDALDREIFEQGRCIKCKGKVKFYPFFKQYPRSYRPWVVCSECGYEREV